jgi:hypothetical protein
MMCVFIVGTSNSTYNFDCWIGSIGRRFFDFSFIVAMSQKSEPKVQQVQKLYEVKVKILFLLKSSHKLFQLC